jgi:hypothetical protein
VHRRRNSEIGPGEITNFIQAKTANNEGGSRQPCKAVILQDDRGNHREHRPTQKKHMPRKEVAKDVARKRTYGQQQKYIHGLRTAFGGPGDLNGRRWPSEFTASILRLAREMRLW